MRTHEQQYPTVTEIIGSTVLPDPTIPVPYEAFANLGNSDDMLVRAAFWTFYAAWLTDQKHGAPGSAATSTAVQARHDGHTLRAITNELTIKDCVLVQRTVIDGLEHRVKYLLEKRVSFRLCWCIAVCLAFVLGMFISPWVLAW